VAGSAAGRQLAGNFGDLITLGQNGFNCKIYACAFFLKVLMNKFILFEV